MKVIAVKAYTLRLNLAQVREAIRKFLKAGEIISNVRK